MKQKIIPIVSIIVGILAFILTGHHLRGKYAEIEAIKARIYAGARQIEVVVASHDIPGGVVIGRQDLRKRAIFESAAPDRVILPSEANLIVGRRTRFEVKATKPILWSDIEGGAPDEASLADAVTPGLRALSIAVSGAAAVSGMLQANDRVDVLGTFALPVKTADAPPGTMETVTLTLLQDVSILAVGNRFGTPRGRLRSAGGGYSTVTLQVTPREAELLVFAQQMKGSLVLDLRNPGDMSFESDLPTVNFDQLQDSLPELNRYRQRTIRHKSDI